jgi:hypothetical protein
LLAAFLLPWLPGPVQAACDPRTGSWWDWERCWSGMRVVVVMGAAVVLLWAWCFHFLFLRKYLARRRPGLWPREAFWRAVAWFVFLFCTAFVATFGWLSDELRHTQWKILPYGLSWLDRNWPWIAIWVGGAVLAFLITYLTRRPRAKAEPAAGE